MRPTSLPPLGEQLHRRLEEIHVKPHRAVELGQLPEGHLALEAIVTDQLPHDRAVFLLDIALVVLAVRPATRSSRRDVFFGFCLRLVLMFLI